jgi:hypothetical protein
MIVLHLRQIAITSFNRRGSPLEGFGRLEHLGYRVHLESIVVNVE